MPGAQVSLIEFPADDPERAQGAAEPPLRDGIVALRPWRAALDDTHLRAGIVTPASSVSRVVVRRKWCTGVAQRSISSAACTRTRGARRASC